VLARKGLPSRKSIKLHCEKGRQSSAAAAAGAPVFPLRAWTKPLSATLGGNIIFCSFR